MSIKNIHHVCIQTEKYRESLEFYTKVLGFKLVKETENFHTRAFNTWLRLENFMIELQTAKAEQRLSNWSSSNEGIVHLCFLVDNVEEELNRIKELGYKNFKLKNGKILYRIENSCLFKIKSPEGTEIEIREEENI